MEDYTNYGNPVNEEPKDYECQECGTNMEEDNKYCCRKCYEASLK